MLKDLFPATAVVAITLFTIKEVLEAIRRYRAEQRKLVAMKALLARECEQNNWAIKNLVSIFHAVAALEHASPDSKAEIKKYPSGLPFARIVNEEGESHTPIAEVRLDTMRKLMLDVATQDKDLFKILEAAHNAMTEVEHVRTSLLRIEDADELMGKDGYMEGLANYALKKLEECVRQVAELYRHCTGEDLTKHRLR